MPQDREVEFIEPSRELQLRARQPGGLTREEAVAGARRAVAELAEDYELRLREDLGRLAELERGLAEAPAGQARARREALLQAVHDVKGLAGTFGYGLVTDICASLYHYLEAVEDDAAHRAELVRSHLESARLVADKGPEGGGEAERQILASLRLAVDKRKARAPHPPGSWAEG